MNNYLVGKACFITFIDIKSFAMKEEVLELSKMIDHSLLHPTLTDSDLKKGCEVASKYHVASVCVKPYMVTAAVELLKGSDVHVGCVIGFPAGNSTTAVKVFEAESACKDGAVEIDMVINIGKALGGNWAYVEEEISSVTNACHGFGALVKVIFETDYVSREEDIVKLCEICTRVGADYVKTSSGFGFVKLENGDYNYQGATLANLKLMKQHVGPGVKVKAAGGVRTLDQLIAVKEAGCTRCGATATVTIMEAAIQRFGE